MTKTYDLIFFSYTNGSTNLSHQIYVEARSMEAAIRKVEKANPEWFFIACRDWWKGPIKSWGLA